MHELTQGAVQWNAYTMPKSTDVISEAVEEKPFPASAPTLSHDAVPKNQVYTMVMSHATAETLLPQIASLPISEKVKLRQLLDEQLRNPDSTKNGVKFVKPIPT